MYKYKYNKRLTENNYEKPNKTLTDKYQNNKLIKEKLKNYKEIPIDEIDFIPIGSHLRYISFDVNNNTELFRFGGTLINRKKDYIVLSGKENKTFSVQRYIKNNKGKIIFKTRFFQLIKNNDTQKDTEKIITDITNKSKQILSKQNDIIQQQQLEIEKLRNLINKSK